MYSVWYHGTYGENVASICQHGLCTTYYGNNFQGFGTPYLTLFQDRSNASLPGRDVVIILHVPDHEAAEYLVAADGGLTAGLRKALLPRMIYAVEELEENERRSAG